MCLPRVPCRNVLNTIMLPSAATSEPVHLWIVSNRCFLEHFTAFPDFCCSGLNLFETCCWHQIQNKHKYQWSGQEIIQYIVLVLFNYCMISSFINSNIQLSNRYDLKFKFHCLCLSDRKGANSCSPIKLWINWLSQFTKSLIILVKAFGSGGCLCHMLWMKDYSHFWAA